MIVGDDIRQRKVDFMHGTLKQNLGKTKFKKDGTTFVVRPFLVRLKIFGRRKHRLWRLIYCILYLPLSALLI